MGTPDYKGTVQDYALAISAWWSKLCHQSSCSNQTRQDYCSFITELTLSSADKTTRQSTRGLRIEINTRPLCQLPHALASNLPSSVHLPILLAFPPSPTEELGSPDNTSTPDLSTDPIGSSACIISFSLSCGWTKISNWKHYWVLGIKFKTKNNFKPWTFSFPAVIPWGGLDKDPPREGWNLAEGCAVSAHNPLSDSPLPRNFQKQLLSKAVIFKHLFKINVFFFVALTVKVKYKLRIHYCCMYSCFCCFQ